MARALEWARETPPEQVIARFREILRQRGRNEDDAALKYWRSFGVNGKGLTISDRECQFWIDWKVKDGELAQNQIAVSSLDTNDLNPYAADVPSR